MDNSTTISITALTPNESNMDPLTPCPYETWELIVSIMSAVAIVLSNAACMKIKVNFTTYQHPENRYYVLNLAVSNILCGVALMGTNSLSIIRNRTDPQQDMERSLVVCMFWAPVYIYCVMMPFVALATLGLDIAYYCHRSMDYQRRMSRSKLTINIASGWVYTLLVVGVTFAADRKVLCDIHHWELNPYFIIFPIFLMLLPAVSVVVAFAFTIRSYWRTSIHLARRMSLSKIGSESDTKGRLFRQFAKKFLHLIVFSILCSIIYTIITAVELVLESGTHERLCALFRLDRLFISLNSLLSPWIYCLATKQVRSRLKRKFLAWWHNIGSFSQFVGKGSARRKRRDTKLSFDLRATSSKDDEIVPTTASTNMVPTTAKTDDFSSPDMVLSNFQNGGDLVENLNENNHLGPVQFSQTQL